MEEGEAAPPPRRGSTGLALLAAAAVLVSAVGAGIYSFSSGGDDEAKIDVSGFDVSKVDEARRVVAAAPAQQQGSSLGMIGGSGGLSFGEEQTRAERLAQEQAGAAAPAAGPHGRFTALIKANSARARALAQAYTKRHPRIAQYGRDWMSYPDLKKLNDDYARNQDPVAFIRGLAQSKNFPILIKKYGRDPAIQSFAKDVLRGAPEGLISAGTAIAKQEGVVGKLMDAVVTSLGLPAGMFGGGSNSKPPDQGAIVNSVLGSNPDIQKALGGAMGGQLQGVMNDPNVSKALKDNPEAVKMMGNR